MRFFLLLFCFLNFAAKAQELLPADKDLNSIIDKERQAYQRLGGAGGGSGTVLTFASNNFDVKYYRCEWEVDPAIRYITGKVTIYYTVTVATNSITLDLMSSLVADSVKQRNTLLTKSQTTNTLTIDFPASVNAGVLDSISVFYKGVPANTGFGSFITDVHGSPSTPVMWSLSEPYGSRDWWPCKNGLDDKADSVDIIVTNPVAYKAAANGMLQSETLIAAGTKRVAHWKHRYPIASYLMCFAVTNFSVFNEIIALGTTNLPFQTYCYPESLAGFQSGSASLTYAMQLFHDKYGDYPFIKEKYGHVQFGWGGGMEHQTSTFIVNTSENLTSHELAHQWFGDKITCGSWEDIWLNEGFATYSTRMYREAKYAANADALLNERKNEINFITSAPDGSVKVDDTTNVNRIFNNRLTYYKGCYVIMMLRWILGDNTFFTAIKNYQKDPALAYGYARTADLKRHLEQASGKNLTEFFKDWYSGQGYPSYKVSWNMVGSGFVNIKMEQTTSHSSVNFFELPVALKFKNATQEQTIVVDNKTNGETFLKSISFLPDTVLVDPAIWLITRNNTTVKLQPVNFPANTIKVGANPFKDKFSIFLYNISAPNLKVILYNTLGQRVITKEVTLTTNVDAEVIMPTANLASGTYFLKLPAIILSM
ncbi:MAG: T9SS type A sorting domain-containing protein [Chitinophagaceae bacterium]|nr:T9SS type A sorting domain-containing protein [Chitinophagaceae bacterium]